MKEEVWKFIRITRVKLTNVGASLYNGCTEEHLVKSFNKLSIFYSAFICILIVLVWSKAINLKSSYSSEIL